MEQNKIIIVGAGAAGLMAALAAPGALVLEKMPRVARKMMITGKGRCNFTNVKTWQDFSRHIHPKANALRAAFHCLPPEKVLDIFTREGLPCDVERGDRAFPSSHKAVDVVDTLLSLARKAGSKIICNCTVTGIEKTSGGFSVSTSAGTHYSCRKLIITCGGLSYPATGSTGDGFRMAERLGHKVTRLYPSLTALVPRGYKNTDSKIMPCLQIDGLSLPVLQQATLRHHIHRDTELGALGKQMMGRSMKNVTATLFVDKSPVQEEFGDVDFTDGGIEGPMGFKLSRRAVIALENGSKVSLEITFKDEKAPLHFDIEGFVGYERAVVTSGGIPTDEIVPKTMESRILKGLYFAGEVLDMDADTGGYNLQLAFSTGYLAGLSANADK